MNRHLRESLNACPVVAAFGLAEESGHFLVCPDCGQAIDWRGLGDVLRHDQPAHRPLLTH